MDRKIRPCRLLLSFLAASTLTAHSQDLTDLRALQRGDSVEVTYRLQGETGKAYSVALFSSHDNFVSPLRLVAGDTGEKRILPGTGKTIIWRARQELTNFDGDIAFEIRAVAASPLFSDINTSVMKVKRGGEVKIFWKGGKPNERVSIYLIKNSTAIQAGTASNAEEFNYAVPKKIKPGKYEVQLRQGGEDVSGAPLTIAARIPLIAKIAVVPVLGLLVYFIVDKPEEFPEPPDLTNN
jgi:hypothetical protein